MFRLALAGLVLGQHCMKLLTPELTSQSRGLVLGPVAVACFFALSGFIVAEALIRFYQPRPLAFLGNRILRVVPPYLLVLVLAILVQSALYATGHLVPLDSGLAGPPWQPRVVLAGMFEIVPGLPAWRISGQGFSFIPYAWTLRIEFAFYLAAFAACAMTERIGPPGDRRRRWVIGVFLALAYVLFARFVRLHGAGAQQILCVPFFGFGLACFFQERRPRALRNLHLLTVSAFVPLAFVYWTQKGHPLLAYQVICLCLLFLAFYGLTRIEHVPAKLHRFDRWAGDLSYPLYIGHGVIVVTLLSLSERRGWDVYGTGVAGSVLLAALLHLLAEVPLRGLRDRLRGHRL